MKIVDKHDTETVEKIIAIGYPENKEYLEELLSWTADPNWPVAMVIYEYLIELGDEIAIHIINLAHQVDNDWKSWLLSLLIHRYDANKLEQVRSWLKIWASSPGSEGCDIQALEILAEQKAIPEEEIIKIARKNLFYYNGKVRDTYNILEKALNGKTFGEYTL
ncbi:DUF5071 domain-containing protein [Rapidithrix thailandica]|uniref:DUF5071 domain-containing protein n=1 Tax=Rapidithrix thailandica TaxID=413964 RepID=A0AAW9RTQ0_9BACT